GDKRRSAEMFERGCTLDNAEACGQAAWIHLSLSGFERSGVAGTDPMEVERARGLCAQARALGDGQSEPCLSLLSQPAAPQTATDCGRGAAGAASTWRATTVSFRRLGDRSVGPVRPDDRRGVDRHPEGTGFLVVQEALASVSHTGFSPPEKTCASRYRE